MYRFIIKFFFQHRKRTYPAIMTLTLALVIYIATSLLVRGYSSNISGMANIIQPSNFLIITEEDKSLSESRVDLDVLTFLEEYAQTTPNLDVILPQLYVQTTVQGETGTSLETHLRLVNFTKFELFQYHKYAYSLSSPDEKELIMGQQLRNLLSSGVGATISLVSENIYLNSTTSTILQNNYTITNIIESGKEYDIELLGSLSAFLDIYPIDYFSFIELKILDTREIEEIVTDVKSEFKQLSIIQEKQTQNFIIYATDEVIKTLTLLEILFFVLMLVSITYSIYTLVKESDKEIFILRSIGATKIHMVGLFMVQALLIGFFSSILAIIIGYLGVSAIVAVVSAVQSLPFLALNIDIGLIGIIFLLAITLSILSGIYPALKAAQIKVIREDHL